MMATQTTTQHSTSLLLRRTLQANGIFSSLGGVMLIAGTVPITAFLGLQTPIILIVAGIVSLLYAVSLFLTTARPSIGRRTGMTYVLLDSAWVVASVVILFTGWVPLTTEGKWAVGLVAVIVAILAELQFLGSRRTS
jgi:hypothetical protein